ncbi:MAG: TonB-dependent receptor [Pseudomonadota bacterium]
MGAIVARCLRLSSVLLSVTALGLPAAAQEAGPFIGDGPMELDEITITARLREEPLFTAPVSASVVAGEDLDASLIEWVFGLSYFRSDFDQDRVQSSSFFGSLSGTYATEIDSETLAVFGDASVPVRERLTLSGGFRVTLDDQEIDSTYTSNGLPGTVPTFSQQDSFNDLYVTGRFAVDYAWTEKIVGFASVARGYASGGFERFTTNAASGIDTPPFCRAPPGRSSSAPGRGCSTIAGRATLARIVAEFAAVHAQVEIGVHCALGIGFDAALAAGSLDLAVFEVPAPGADQEVLREDALIWLGRADRAFAPDEPLPVALSSLEAAGRRFQVVFTSESSVGVRAAVDAGIAVGLLSAAEDPAGLAPVAGLEARHPTCLVLQHGPSGTGPACDAMCDAIRRAFLC